MRDVNLGGPGAEHSADQSRPRAASPRSAAGRRESGPERLVRAARRAGNRQERAAGLRRRPGQRHAGGAGAGDRVRDGTRLRRAASAAGSVPDPDRGVAGAAAGRPRFRVWPDRGRRGRAGPVPGRPGRPHAAVGGGSGAAAARHRGRYTMAGRCLGRCPGFRGAPGLRGPHRVAVRGAGAGREAAAAGRADRPVSARPARPGRPGPARLGGRGTARRRRRRPSRRGDPPS